MAIRLSKDLSNNSGEETSSKSIIVSGSEGSNYDLDNIEKNRSRTSNSELLTQVSNNKATIGSVITKKDESRIFANNLDSVNYLFGNESSTSSYSPQLTLRRPIILWKEGSEPTPGYNQEPNSLYSEINRLNEMISLLKEELNQTNIKTDTIDIDKRGNLKTDGSLIPTVQAIYDFISTFHDFKKFAENSIDEITDDDPEIQNHYAETITGSADIETAKDMIYPLEDTKSLDLTDSRFSFSSEDDSNEYIIVSP